ncbi:MAG: fatty acid desaturase family protein [Acidimicrobiales bacterium]
MQNPLVPPETRTGATATTAVADQVAAEPTDWRAEFAELSRQVRDAGLLAQRTRYYAVKITATVAALLALMGGAIALGDSWWDLVLGAGFAFVMAQLAFIGHDAGHRQVSGHRPTNDAIGLVLANLLTGFSFGWWLNKHSRHHAHPNQPGKDPDIAPGALVYTPEQVEGCRGLRRWFTRIQVVTLLPLLFLEAVNLHVAAVRDIPRRRRGALTEAVLLAGHFAIFFVGPFLLLSPIRAALFIGITQAVFGFYLGGCFLTNHVGMPTLDGNDRSGFLVNQVVTSRNLRGRRFTGFLFGGLDTQIEHHLFPAMPRANLRRARELVRPFCAERSIAYTEDSPWHAYHQVLRHLRTTGAAANERGN